MIIRDDKISITEQCKIVGVSKSSYYYEEKQESDDEKAIKIAINELFEELPFYGYRRIYEELKICDIKVGRDRTLKYMNELGLKTIFPTKKTTIANKEHKKYPYLLKDLEITQSNQVWSSDITYLRLPTGYVYFVTIIDWYSRKTLSSRFSNTLDAKFCCEALEEAILKYGKPEIFNTDQGSQFTSEDFTKILLENKIKISMDSVGRWADNIIVERFFRTLKYENFYLFKYETFTELKIGITKYLKFYNERRIHSSLGYKTPDEIYNQSVIEFAA